MGEIRTNPAYRQGDIQDEFLNHWLGEEGDLRLTVHLGSVNPKSARTNYFSFEQDGVKLFALSDYTDEAEKLALAVTGKAAKSMNMPCWIFQTDAIPFVPAAIPATVKEVFAWLKAWDIKLYQAFQRVLEKERDYLKFKLAHFAIHSPSGWLGFGFALDQVKRLGSLKRPGLFKQYLNNSGGKTAIFRLDIIEMGPEFVHSRNLTYSDLSGKRISVIGCGAIGSFLAESLVRLGAGARGGELKLVDGDVLKPENLGRHALGYGSLFRNKAAELARDLVAKFPLAKVTPHGQDFSDNTTFGRAQLVIDATGEEAFSEMLNAMRIAGGKVAPPVLHVRVRGNGECVQTFWAEGSADACLRCLLSAEPADYRRERHSVLKTTTVRRRRGCTGYTPFSVASSLSAAALATEVIVDWLQNSTPHPRLRTRAMSNADVYQVKDQTVARNLRCPACGK